MFLKLVENHSKKAANFIDWHMGRRGERNAIFKSLHVDLAPQTAQ
jgi:hypothetical protein